MVDVSAVAGSKPAAVSDLLHALLLQLLLLPQARLLQSSSHLLQQLSSQCRHMDTVESVEDSVEDIAMPRATVRTVELVPEPTIILHGGSSDV